MKEEEKIEQAALRLKTLVDNAQSICTKAMVNGLLNYHFAILLNEVPSDCATSVKDCYAILLGLAEGRLTLK